MGLQSIEAQGYRVRAVSAHHFEDLRASVAAHYKQGHFDPHFYDTWLADEYDPRPTRDLPVVRSLIVVATRQPRVRFTFAWRGRRASLIVPPIYLGKRETNRRVERAVAEALAPEGYRVLPAVVPKKLLAVQSGLAEYGRNNIAYVPGMGSFHRLVTFYSDMPCGDDGWREPTMMARCERCRACARRCPSGAIGRDDGGEETRFLLRGERCIVSHNELPSEVPFPEWLEAAWHRCLVGCMTCQEICPENRPYLDENEDENEDEIKLGAAFSEEETALLLQGVAVGQMPGPLVAKLKSSDLIQWMRVFPRNLKLLLKKGDGSESLRD